MTYFTCAAFGMLIVRYHTNNIYAKFYCSAGPSSDLAALGHLPPGEGRTDRAGRGRNAEDSVPYGMKFYNKQDDLHCAKSKCAACGRARAPAPTVQDFRISKDITYQQKPTSLAGGKPPAHKEAPTKRFHPTIIRPLRGGAS